MSDIWNRLKAPFPPAKVSWRVGATSVDKSKGLALAYIDARDVMERLDEVVGPENWERNYPHAGVKTVCEISIKVDGNWVSKSDGAGDTDTEAEKGALSDAFKRAAVNFGIGRYLYDLENIWVAIEASGRSYKIKDSEYKSLRATLQNIKVATTGNPLDQAVTKDATRALKDELCNEINAHTNELALNAWGRNTANKARKMGLHPDFQDEVSNCWMEKMRELKPKAVA